MNLAQQEGRIWFDGKLVDWQDAKIHVLSHGLHYGTGVFEGIRAYETRDSDGGSAIFRLRDHCRRLLHSAHIIAMDIGYDVDALVAAHIETVRANGLGDCYIRSIAFYGANALGISAKRNPVHLVIAAWSWGSYLGEEALQRGIRVKTSSFSRHHVNVSMCRAKACGHYLNSVLAYQEISADGYDEALILDVDGFVSEGSGENLFIVRDDAIYTPELTSALAGITRDTIFTLAKDLGYTLIERRLTRDDVYCADEAFFTGTAAEVTPIVSVDNRRIGNGQRGRITEALQQGYFSAVSDSNSRYAADWQTPIAR